MNFLTQTEGLILLLVFGVIMVSLVWIRTHTERSLKGFLIANHNAPAWRVGLSLAISWAWAPAFFVCSLQAYKNGLAGVFWFTLPNILTFFFFIPFAIRLRKMMPEGYTLPQYMNERYGGHKLVHIAFIIAVSLQVLVAFVANANAGGLLLHTLSGIDRNTAVAGMIGIALAYSLLSGLRASIFTDIVQMGMVFLFIAVLVPWVLVEVNGFQSVMSGLGGITGEHSSVFHPGIAFAMGIPMSVTLFTTPFCDQIFVQRIFAVKKESVAKSLAIGGISFGIIPITLSLLGFVAVTLVKQGGLDITNPEMVGPAVIGHLLPIYALYGFTVMAFAGLCSTIDSALCAISSIGAVDIYKTYIQPDAQNMPMLKIARMIMLAVVAIGLPISFLQPDIMWVFIIGGCVTASTFFPVLLSLIWDKLSPTSVFFSVITSLIIGLPYAIYANIVNDQSHIVYASLLSVFIPLVICILGTAFSIIAKKAPAEAIPSSPS